MKLLIAERIYNHRKRKNMTQEELAASIGVSSQAVSDWERSCGYPDITLLPGIAHTLGITIDELMGNDQLGVSEDLEWFYKRIWEVDDEEKLRMAVEYCRKYPDNYGLMDTLILIISDRGFAEVPEYKAMLRDAAEKIISGCTDNRIRYYAIEAMCRCCDEDEADRWLDMCPQTISSVRGEIFEERLWNRGKSEDARVQGNKNYLSLMLHIIGRESHHEGIADRSIEHNAYLRELIHTFGKNGEIPDGWVGKYAFITLRYAAALFGAGKIDEGFAAFDEAMEMYKRLFAHPDNKPLDLGCRSMFGNISVVQHRKAGSFDTYEDGAGNEVKILEGYYFTQDPSYLYHILTNRPDWAWFDCVRDDERFTTAVAWAKDMADRFTAEIEK